MRRANVAQNGSGAEIAGDSMRMWECGIVLGGKVNRAWDAASPYERRMAPLRAAVLDREHRVSLQHFRGSSADVHHETLPCHILSLHLGGPKRIRRSGADGALERAADTGSVSVIPAWQAYRWQTQGPVEFAHLVFGPELLHRAALEEFDRAPPDLALRAELAIAAPLLRQTLTALVDDLGCERGGRLYRDGLLAVLSCVLLRDHSNLARRPAAAPARRGGMPGWALSRVVDFMEAHLDEDFALGDLVALTGLSRAQFYRAFRQSTGVTPGAYRAVLRRRRSEQPRA